VGRGDGRPAAEPGCRGTVLTRLLLDTSTLTDAERVLADLDALIADDDEPAVAAITIAEPASASRSPRADGAKPARRFFRPSSKSGFDDLPGVNVRTTG
jgi:hypothetical protein